LENEIKVKKPFYKKVWFWLIVVALWIFFKLIGSLITTENNQVEYTSETIQKESIQDTPIPIEKKAPIPKKVIPKNIKGYTKYFLKNKFEYEDKKKIRDVDLTEGTLFIELNAKENDFVENLQEEAFEIFQGLSRKNGYKEINIQEYMLLQDKYGKKEKIMVFSCSIKKSNLKKIEWDNVIYLDLEQFSDFYFVHPALK
jgi:hypothetical protein